MWKRKSLLFFMTSWWPAVLLVANPIPGDLCSFGFGENSCQLCGVHKLQQRARLAACSLNLATQRHLGPPLNGRKNSEHLFPPIFQTDVWENRSFILSLKCAEFVTLKKNKFYIQEFFRIRSEILSNNARV